MIGKVFKIIIRLYASFRTGLRTGRAVSSGSLKIDDLAALAVSRRADLNPDTNALLSVGKKPRGAANAGIAANRLMDKESGLTDRRIAPGGAIEGLGLKIAGDAAGVGLFPKNIETGQATQIPETSIMENRPAAVSFVVPAHPPEGEYQLSTASRFSPGSKKPKVPLACVFAAPLKCNRGKAGINKQKSPAG